MTADPPVDERALAARARAGDEAAFARLMAGGKDRLYAFIRRYTGDADEAYDLLQETFVSAWRALDRYDADRPFPAWLRGIAINKCRDWSRRRAVRRWFVRADRLEAPAAARIADAAPSQETALIDRQRLDALDAAIAALPPSLKEPLLLTALEGMSQAEAGRQLGISAKAVEVRVYRARRALEARLAIAAGQTGAARDDQ
ncbi:MAG: RNA polymerase sigma factor [Pseudomonadota bacterium]